MFNLNNKIFPKLDKLRYDIFITNMKKWINVLIWNCKWRIFFRKIFYRKKIFLYERKFNMYLQIDIYLPFIPFLFNFYSCKQLYLFILTIFIFFINLSFFNSFFELIYNIIKYKISKQIYLSTTVIIYFEFHLRLMRLKITAIISKT